jgi:hypothetical protein
MLIVQHDGYILNPDLWTDEFLEYDYIGAPWEDGTVGNGGFSLRSQRLMETVASMTWRLHHEDCLICGPLRGPLEDAGFKFAPTDVAARFSFERYAAGYQRTFGFHSAGALAVISGRRQLVVPPKQAFSFSAPAMANHRMGTGWRRS